ncbi:hypothetical protein [Micromonospora purpureochromogenes]|uniref:hypothetical protein n=1 Tax=Micromonospora purpureochromogenes TaxID=47872 RepID=UPI001E5A71F5|nr:hypothetical protein [Micromonospora purpureochromogenes]
MAVLSGCRRVSIDGTAVRVFPSGGSVGNRKRSGRRQRRKPIRQMIPPTRVPGSRRPHHPDETALMPVYEYSPMFGRLVDAPVEMVPLLAVLAVLHQAQSGMPVGTCVPTSHQVSWGTRADQVSNVNRGRGVNLQPAQEEPAAGDVGLHLMRDTSAPLDA